MKNFLASLLSSLGRKDAADDAQPKFENTKTMRFNIPTVAADDIEFVLPTSESFAGAPQFHEDEWRELEFFPHARLDEIKRKLAEYKAFEQAHRTETGWTDIYARRIIPSAVLPGRQALDQIADMLKTTRLPGPILTTSRPRGHARGGFTLPLAGKGFLYGVADDAGVQVLAAKVPRFGNDAQIKGLFAELNKAYQLVLADWRLQTLFIGLVPTGEIDIWRP